MTEEELREKLREHAVLAVVSDRARVTHVIPNSTWSALGARAPALCGANTGRWLSVRGVFGWLIDNIPVCDRCLPVALRRGWFS